MEKKTLICISLKKKMKRLKKSRSTNHEPDQHASLSLRGSPKRQRDRDRHEKNARAHPSFLRRSPTSSMRNDIEVPRYPYASPQQQQTPSSPQSSIRSIPFQPEPSSPTNPLCPNIQMPLGVVGIVCVCGVVFFKSLPRISSP